MESGSDRDRAELRRAFRLRVRETAARQIEVEKERAREARAVVIPLVSNALSCARKEGACGRAWLFGSFAWGEPGDRSDVDLLVESCADPDGLAGRVWKVAGRPVHVVQLERAPETLKARVLAEGRPI